MKEKNSFYIGWKDEMPKVEKSFLKKIIIPLFILIPLLAFVFVWGQKPFNNHLFEFGNITEYTGIYHAQPVPILEVTSGTLSDDLSNHILLVGYAKFGAEGIINEIEISSGALDNKKVTLQGSLIYGDGKAVLELTKKNESLVKIFDDNPTKQPNASPRSAFKGRGEILDPKCYFGQMKPGEGKIHKSCAIRCISGGIPPIFRVKEKGLSTYYILVGANGEKINAQILDRVGEDVTITGDQTILNGWKVIHADPSNIQ